MPIAHRVDHKLRLVVAVGYGTVTAEDLFAYQREVASRPDAAGYDEVVDMTPVIHIAAEESPRARDLASLAASTDRPEVRTRFAIVAPTDLAFGLGRMYQSYRENEPRTTKQVAVFRTMEEACRFLGVEPPLELPRYPTR